MSSRVLLSLATLVTALWVPLMALAQSTPAGAPATPPGATSGAPRGEPPSDAATEKDDDEIVAESRKWLGLIDDGKAGLAWDGADALLRSSVTRAKWIEGIRDLRKSYGKARSRSAQQVVRAHSLPGAPDGDYTIIQFDTEFGNGRHAAELIMWSLTSTSWRVAGYQIR
jgi:hypothetical protein